MRRNTDYSKYVLSIREKLIYGSIFAVCTVIAAELLFGLWWSGIIAGAVLLPFFYLRLSSYLRDRRIGALEEEFALYMQLAAAALAGGTSFENVFREVADNVASEDNSIMKKEFYNIDRMIRLHYDSRDAFDEFAQRSGSKDIKSISAALLCTAVSGGNTVSLLRSGVSALRLKQDTEREIRRIISLPRMNHRIMTAMPFAFILLLRTISPEYVKCLYVWPGQLIMAAVSVLVAAAWLLGEKIGKIRL